jgi:uncharacterized protein YlxW (UPF0749 family)
VNPFASRIAHNNNWVIPVSLMCLILGFLIAMSRVTGSNRSTRISLLNAQQQGRVTTGSIDLQEAYTKMQVEVETLRADKTKLENALSDTTKGSKVLNESLQESKAFAGLMEVEGPGISVTLHDATKRSQDIDLSAQAIHDLDVLRVVNELFASGAEAISVNNHRVASTTSFRCVGTTILVDSVRIAPPVVIRAIGDPNTLLGGMNLPGGVLDEIKQADKSMVQTELVEKMRLPGYSGPTSQRYAKVVKDTN